MRVAQWFKYFAFTKLFRFQLLADGNLHVKLVFFTMYTAMSCPTCARV